MLKYLQQLLEGAKGHQHEQVHQVLSQVLSRARQVLNQVPPSQPFTTEQTAAITALVSIAIRDALAGLNQASTARPRDEQSFVVSPPTRSDDPTTCPAVERSFGNICSNFESLGAHCLEEQSSAASASYDQTTEVPAAYIKAIQSGEFFELSKLLPKNLHKMQIDSDENEFSLSVGKNSELKLSKRSPRHSKILNIDDWTTAFTLFMKVMSRKYPLKATELIKYMDTIRSAAKQHNYIAWQIYDYKFRHKFANNKAASCCGRESIRNCG
eukprot:Seg90.11 transcript_id=Seg90.11/GoldUCD/mRNA.D3Y31 product="hypothetical protein" protein_id=Seg90.11/GoldUCD/D3Y31